MLYYRTLNTSEVKSPKEHSIAVSSCISCSECVFVALIIQKAVAMPHIFICPARHNNIFLHYLLKGTIFRKNVTEYKMCFYFLYNLWLEHVSF